MSEVHKVCCWCKESLPLDSFKCVHKTNGNGEIKTYKHSYCKPCEVDRQAAYNKQRKPKEGVVTLKEYNERRAKSKQERLAREAKQKEQRRKQRQIKRQRKAEQRNLDKKIRLEEGKAKWEAWYAEYSSEENLAKLKEEAREKGKQAREERLANGVKTCSSCNEGLPLSQFHMRTRKKEDGYSYKTPYSHCKSCRRINNRKHDHTPKGKARKKRNSALRVGRNRQATPKWLNPEQKQQIVDIYEHMRDCRAVTGEDYHVDHIVPIGGENICGLHVPWNLQVLPAYVNISKANKVLPMD